MTEYEVKLNGKVVGYIIHQNRKSVKKVKAELKAEGWDANIVVSFYKSYGE